MNGVLVYRSHGMQELRSVQILSRYECVGFAATLLAANPNSPDHLTEKSSNFSVGLDLMTGKR